MKKKPTPQPAPEESGTPITREEFEAGVKFHLPDKHYIPGCDDYYKEDKWICDKRKNFHCHIQYIEDDGFVFINFILGHKVEGKVLFANCLKSPNQ